MSGGVVENDAPSAQGKAAYTLGDATTVTHPPATVTCVGGATAPTTTTTKGCSDGAATLRVSFDATLLIILILSIAQSREVVLQCLGLPSGEIRPHRFLRAERWHESTTRNACFFFSINTSDCAKIKEGKQIVKRRRSKIAGCQKVVDYSHTALYLADVLLDVLVLKPMKVSRSCSLKRASMFMAHCT